MNLAARMTLDSGGFTGPLGGAQQGMSSFLGKARGLIAPLAAIAAGFLGVATAAGAVSRASNEAASLEDMQTSFVTLLGSTEAAKDRIGELAEFAASTPFELPGIVGASRSLETLTQGALATGDGLRIAGDLAAASGQPFQDLAVHVGRLYDGLQNGTAVGESLMRLTELGLIGGQTRREIEALQKTGAQGDQVWAVAAQAFGRFSGEMERRSGTFNGLLSTLKDNIAQVFREFGAPINDALKPYLRSGIDLAKQLAESARAWGASVASTAAVAAEVFQSGKLSDVLAASLKVGLANAGDFFLRHMTGVVAGLASAMELLPRSIAESFEALSSASFWQGIGNLALAAFEQLGGHLLRIFEKPILALQAGVDAAMSQAVAALPYLARAALGVGDVEELSFDEAYKQRQAEGSFLTDAGRASIASGEKRFAKGLEQLAPFLEKRFELLGDALDKLSAGYAQGFATDNLLTGLSAEAQAELDVLFESVKAGITETKAAVEGTAAATQAAGGTAAGGAQGGVRFETDSLQRIGGFVGASGPAADHARRTADNTAKLVQILEREGRAMLSEVPVIPAWS